MKYYVGNIDEQYGEFEVQQSILFATAGDPDEVMEEIAKDWYGLDEHDSDGLRKVCTGMRVWPMGLVVITR